METPGAPAQAFEALLPDASVVVTRADGTRVECAWDASRRRHACPGMPAWQYTGLHQMTVDGSLTPCIWSHPLTGDAVTTSFHRVSLGKTLTLAGALADDATLNPDGAPVTVRARIDGDVVVQVERSNATGFARATAAVPNGPRNADVVVEVTTPDDGQRHFCFRLETSP
jgi:hypothetical protein